MINIKKIRTLKEGGASWKEPTTYRVFSADDVAPTLTTHTGGQHEVKILEKKHTHGCYIGVSDGYQHGLYPDQARTLLADLNRNAVLERFIVASRGRDPTNPKGRIIGAPTRQRLEAQPFKRCGTLSTALKDNLCLECEIKEVAGREGEGETSPDEVYKTKDGKVYSFIPSKPDAVHVAVVYKEGGEVYYKEVVYRIRKLTPKECWRLMGFSDTDFEAAKKVTSNTGLYNQAGNSIVKDVLMAIFKQLL